MVDCQKCEDFLGTTNVGVKGGEERTMILTTDHANMILRNSHRSSGREGHYIDRARGCFEGGILPGA